MRTSRPEKAAATLDKLFGRRDRTQRRVQAAPRPHHVETPREAAQREARERQQRQYQRYLDARAARLDRMRREHPGVERYLKALTRLAPTVEVYTRTDVDVDLAELAQRCGLDTLPAVYERWTIVEYTMAWIAALRPRMPIEDQDIFPTAQRRDTITDLKAALLV